MAGVAPMEDVRSRYRGMRQVIVYLPPEWVNDIRKARPGRSNKALLAEAALSVEPALSSMLSREDATAKPRKQVSASRKAGIRLAEKATTRRNKIGVGAYFSEVLVEEMLAITRRRRISLHSAMKEQFSRIAAIGAAMRHSGDKDMQATSRIGEESMSWVVQPPSWQPRLTITGNSFEDAVKRNSEMLVGSIRPGLEIRRAQMVTLSPQDKSEPRGSLVIRLADPANGTEQDVTFLVYEGSELPQVSAWEISIPSSP